MEFGASLTMVLSLPDKNRTMNITTAEMLIIFCFCMMIWIGYPIAGILFLAAPQIGHAFLHQYVILFALSLVPMLFVAYIVALGSDMPGQWSRVQIISFTSFVCLVSFLRFHLSGLSQLEPAVLALFCSMAISCGVHGLMRFWPHEPKEISNVAKN
jgi:hypothetical protein